MRRYQLIAIPLTALCLVGGWSLQSPAQQGLGERLGKQLDRGVRSLSRELREGWAEIRAQVDELSEQGRVYARLKWDKGLAGSSLQVDSEQEHVVVLQGNVPSDTARQTAVRLAQDTVGIERVIDRLQVVTPVAE